MCTKNLQQERWDDGVIELPLPLSDKFSHYVAFTLIFELFPSRHYPQLSHLNIGRYFCFFLFVLVFCLDQEESSWQQSRTNLSFSTLTMGLQPFTNGFQGKNYKAFKASESPLYVYDKYVPLVMWLFEIGLSLHHSNHLAFSSEMYTLICT